MKVFLSLVFCITFARAALAQDNPVIIELFTSQGCSSCPAADKNLGEIIRKAEAQGKPVYGLSFHVDYWNHIGWKDPYSSKEFTERQRRYGEILNLNSIYTPQMIVNGKREFVGSDKKEAQLSLTESMRTAPNFQLVIESAEVSDGQIHIKYSVDKIPKGEMLNVAIVEKDVENYVSRGENKGRTLHHDNVVRIFKTELLQQSGKTDIKATGIDLSKCRLILYIQDSKLEVLGSAARLLK